MKDNPYYERPEDMQEFIKEEYERKTGHELPDHVARNLDALNGTMLGDYTAELEGALEAHRREREREKQRENALLLLLGAGSGIVGLYLSRFVSGTLGQIAGGTLGAVFAFGLGMILLTTVEKQQENHDYNNRHG